MIGGFLHRPRLQRAEFSFCCKRHGPPCFSCLPDRACSHRDWVCAEQKASNTLSSHSSGWLCLTDSRIWFSCSDELGWLCREQAESRLTSTEFIAVKLNENWTKIKRRREHERFSVCFQLVRTVTTLKALNTEICDTDILAFYPNASFKFSSMRSNETVLIFFGRPRYHRGKPVFTVLLQCGLVTLHSDRCYRCILTMQFTDSTHSLLFCCGVI